MEALKKFPKQWLLQLLPGLKYLQKLIHSFHLGLLFRQINRILKKNGLFVFSFDHHFYSIIDPKTLKVIRAYKNQKIVEEEFWDVKKHKCKE